MMVNCCGLLTADRQPVPLKSIEVEVEVRDHVSTVVSTLNYENKEDKAVEAVFVFPLPGDAAVCHFSAQIGQTQVVAEVKEKQQAREEYDDALSSGQQAFLLEESEQSPDIFTLSVGSLPPGESASIRLEYVTELAVQADDGLRFCLPAVLNPRYQPQGSEDASVQVTSVPASLVPYTLSLSVRVSSPRPVSKLESSCSLDPLQYLNTDQTQATVKLAAGHKFDRDVELLIYYKDAHQPSAVMEAGQASAKPGTLMGDPAVMVSLYPEFPQSVMSSVASCGEFVFLMDRSGSMGSRMNHSESHQTRISSARDTLLLLLKSLPMGCYFNIYSFGSSYEHIFPTSVEYSDKTMAEALKKVEAMEANFGGTEILKPLKHIFSQACIPSQPRQLFVFTDGEVCNTKEVIHLVKNNSGSHRCFSFGIGEGASSALINGLAKEGGGHAQFITGKDRMQPKVMQSLRFALQPAVVDISVTWDLPEGVSATVLSPPITSLFQGQRSLIYGQLSGESSEAAEGSVTVKYSLAGHPSENQLRFSLRPAEDTGLTVHRLGARTLIRSLEMKEKAESGEQGGGVKEKVVDVSVQAGVSSSFTAFIAVNKGDGQAINGPLIRRDIPTPARRLLRGTIFNSRAFAPLQGAMFLPQSAGGDAYMRRHLGAGGDTYILRSCPRIGAASRTKSKRIATSGSFGLSNMKQIGGLLDRNAECESLDRGRASRTKSKGKAKSASFGLSNMKQKFGRLLKRNAECKSPALGSGIEPLETDMSDVKGKAGALSGQLCRDSLLQMVSLQKASGCWLLDPALAAALGKTSQEVEQAKPSMVNQEVWATILALIWLHGFKMDAQEEWELLAMKAVSWLRAQNAPSLSECVEAGKTLLGCSLGKDALRL